MTTVKTVLICGSRKTTPAMRDLAEKCVRRCKEQGYRVVVGDAPGIDQWTIIFCNQYNVPYTCYGIAEAPRAIEVRGAYVRIGESYTARDKAMVEAADVCIAIWNGESKGTLATYRYAASIGIEARLLRPTSR